MERIQRKRTAGWRMPDDGVYAGRGSAYGNPFAMAKHTYTPEQKDKEPIIYYTIKLMIENEFSLLVYQVVKGNFFYTIESVISACIDCYEKYILLDHKEAGNNSILSKMRRELPGKKIACWCPLDQPCHVDTIIKLVNSHE